MQIQVVGRHINVTDALRSYVNDKFARIDRHTDDITSVKVTLSPEPNSHKAESAIRVAGGELFASAEAHDMYAAIDLLIDKMDRQVRKHKSKIISRNQGN
ncbi:MAG TPA: ribosome-associated translation inhibitor RaiA [Alcanivoracaceae bacterium]|nr:ribosome-associated translation inhibitor RaiA [Alcanivoracaceae bacterium]